MDEQLANSKSENKDDTPPVLVIDDSDIALQAITDILYKEGIKVRTLRSAFGATKTVLRHQIEVVITDINMPALRGNTLIAFFRKNPKLKHVRVVFVSSLPYAELKALAEQTGADGMVSKDRLEIDLVTVVKQQIHRKRKTT